MDKQTENIAATKLSALIGEYLIWFSQVVRAGFYPDQTDRAVSAPAFVRTIPEICEKLQSEIILDRIVSSQSNLHQIADNFIGMEGPPSAGDYDLFWQTYEGVSTQLQRLERDLLLSDFGIDVQTGLRSSSVMLTELERELERRSRRGQPFAIAVLRIDDASLRGEETILAMTASAISKTIRSFDDAYVLKGGEFVVSLKHSDSTGALRFVARFNSALKDIPEASHTVSACVAEPLPGDEIPQLLANIRADLDHLSGMERGSSGQYEEISPLNRFLQSLQEGGEKGEEEV